MELRFASRNKNESNKSRHDRERFMCRHAPTNSINIGFLLSLTY